jgi:hypothetical protein
MTIKDFTVEEINLIAIYKSDAKEKTISRLNDMYEFMDDEMQPIATSAARKLNAMTRAEFALSRFIPADDGDWDE